ncbi:MAG: NAD(+) diphosphatase [Hyphomicrobiales bacterium]
MTTTGRWPAFVHGAIDRGEQHRHDPAWIAAALRHPSTRVIGFDGDKALLDETPTGPALHHLPAPASDEDAVLLSVAADGTAVFARDATGAAPDGAAGRDLRALAVEGRLRPEDLGLLAQARSLLLWHQRHRFCANCGAATVVADAGWRRVCPACEASHFPRTDPVAIVAVRHGERLLLGRQPHFPPGMYSALAGFVEPGETIEQAARREIFEEAGVRVGALTYHSSQPWPFPSSLMIGLLGEAEDDRLVIDRTELEDARWFAFSECRAMLDGTHPEGFKAPMPLAIAHHLIRAMLAR